MFARLSAAEGELETHFYVQFAGQSANLVDLRDRWRTWWRDNKDKSPDNWRRDALGQAVDELTSEKWWRRMLSARRLMRLTGRAVIPPDVFDLPGWKRLQDQWRRWSELNGDGPPLAWLLAAGVEAGLLPRGTSNDANDADAHLDDLVKLAGFAPQPLGDAALLRLQTWPDRQALLASALLWQRSPRRRLANWVRWRASAIASRRRLIYTAEDLKRPTTQRSTQPTTGPTTLPSSQSITLSLQGSIK